MKSNFKPWLYGPDWQGQRCEAKTRRGTLCRRPAKFPVGKCKFHGGASSGPKTKEGLARLAASKTTHGRTSKLERAKAKHRADVGGKVKREIQLIEEWALAHGNLHKNWRNQLK